MVLNPEPHLRPLSISRGPCPIEGPRSGSTSARMDPSLPSRGVGMSTSNTPVNRHLIFRHMRVNQVAPRPRESGPDDVRPKKKQRALGTAGPSNPSTTTPTLPVMCDIPPEGFSSDESDEVNYRGNSASNPRASPPSVNPSADGQPSRSCTSGRKSSSSLCKSGCDLYNGRDCGHSSKIIRQPSTPSLDGC